MLWNARCNALGIGGRIRNVYADEESESKCTYMINVEALEFGDKTGKKVLDLMAEAGRFNHWMYERIRPFCTGSLIEMGSGIGNISDFLLRGENPVTLSDMRAEYCSLLQAKYESHPHLNSIHRVDLSDPDFDETSSGLLGQFDTVIALNVIEHIANDALAVANCRKLLRPDGKLVILVPAWQALFNDMDRQLGHQKRYTAKTLNHLLAKNHFKQIHSSYFNLAGIAGWFWTGSVLRKKTIPPGELRLFNKLVPLFRLMDRITFFRLGLSVISVGKL